MHDTLEHYLSPLFEASSIAVFGVSKRENAIATVVFNNLLANNFDGPVIPINPKYNNIAGNPCFSHLAETNTPIQLAIVATPAETVPGILEQCGEHGVKAAIVLSAGFSESGQRGRELEHSIGDIAKRYDMRFIGPNCLGVIRPAHKFNATFAGGCVAKGNIALISQSGAICTAILDWAENQDIGFSVVVSMGISLDIDFGEILDYLIADPKTHSILMYVEGIREARAFMSGLRAAARVKPVIVVKAGRHQSSVIAAQSHTGALIGSDDVFDAALRRAGVVRGMHIGDLFAAATVLSRGLRIKGDKLALITNGGGPAAMACDKASDLNIPLAELSPTTIATLNAALPPMWSHGNPVDILGDADADRYETTTRTVLEDQEISGVIVILTPQAITDPENVAQRMATISHSQKKPMLACWMGERQVQTGRAILNDAAIPSFRLPETAVQGFSYLTDFYRNQKLLLQAPGSLFHDQKPDLDGARFIIASVLADKRSILTETESKAILAAFHIPIAPAVIAATPIDAVVAAENIGFPVAMKIHSKEISHKSDFGGVRLNITSAAAVHAIFEELITTTRQQLPQASIEGVVVEPMVRAQNGRELLVGIYRDPVFGPVITFGSGGATVEILADRAVSLPPLNRLLAQDLISRTRAAQLLKAFRNMPAVQIQAVENTLLRVSEIACELPEITELDINPLIADPEGVIAVDARIVVQRYQSSGVSYSHMAIHPYPSHLIHKVLLAGTQPCVIRPIRPEDSELERLFVEGLSENAKHYRFMNNFRKLPPEMLARFTQIDYDREMALIAVLTLNGEDIEIGVARYIINIDADSCEFAITVTDAWQGKGVAQILMGALMECARARGLQRMYGEVLADNHKMLRLARKLGFRVKRKPDDTTLVQAKIDL